LHHSQLAEHIGDFSDPSAQVFTQLQTQGLGPDQVLALMNRLIDIQAYTLAADELFYGAAALFLVLVAFIWLAHPRRGRPGAVVSDAH